MSAAIAVGLMVAGGVYLVLQRGLVRIAIGFVLLGHAVNILLVATGGMQWREAPLLGSGDPAAMADPLPQAFVLTAIVITFGITVVMLAIARSGGDDDPDRPSDPDGPPLGSEPAGGVAPGAAVTDELGGPTVDVESAGKPANERPGATGPGRAAR